MPLVFVQRYVLGEVAGGTQTITGTLSFDGLTEIILDPTVFNKVGKYVLFDYSAGSFPGGQAELTANVIINDDDLINLSAGAPVDDTANKRITVDVTT